jgi:hypothetical protein
MELYKKSCGKLIHVVKYEKSDAVKTTLQGRLMGYLNRAEELKATLEIGSKPPASASNPNPPPGAAAEDDSEDNEPFDLHAELAKRVGLPEVKRQVLSLEHTLKIDKRRMETNPGYAPAGLHMHMLFRGPPGCGKTTMARLIAKSMKTLGVLKKGHLVEVQRSDLVAGHIGQTATKTRAVVESARGGVLFIDECYRLSPADAERDFGKEAIDELMMPMEAGDPLIIFAGYDDPQMDAFVGSNPGLFRRINHSFVFEAYSTSELGEVTQAFEFKLILTPRGDSVTVVSSRFFCARWRRAVSQRPWPSATRLLWGLYLRPTPPKSSESG